MCIQLTVECEQFHVQTGTFDSDTIHVQNMGQLTLQKLYIYIYAVYSWLKCLWAFSGQSTEEFHIHASSKTVGTALADYIIWTLSHPELMYKHETDGRSSCTVYSLIP